jgi:hypothetical protein
MIKTLSMNQSINPILRKLRAFPFSELEEKCQKIKAVDWQKGYLVPYSLLIMKLSNMNLLFGYQS